MAQVSQITLQAGGAPVHFVIADQGGNPLLPSVIQSWMIEPPLQAGLVISADATGFFFSWQGSAAPPAGIGNVTASFHVPGSGQPVRRSFPVIIANATSVTDLTLFQQ